MSTLLRLYRTCTLSIQHGSHFFVVGHSQNHQCMVFLYISICNPLDRCHFGWIPFRIRFYRKLRHSLRGSSSRCICQGSSRGCCHIGTRSHMGPTMLSASHTLTLLYCNRTPYDSHYAKYSFTLRGCPSTRNLCSSLNDNSHPHHTAHLVASYSPPPALHKSPVVHASHLSDYKKFPPRLYICLNSEFYVVSKRRYLHRCC